MERLSAHSMRHLLDFLESSAVVQDLNDFRHHVIRSMHDLIPCDIVAYSEVDLAQGATASLHDPPESIPSSLYPAFNAFSGEHPLIRHYAERRDGGAVRVSDFLSTYEFRHLGLYAEFFAPLSVEHQMAFVLPAPEPLVVGVALNRTSHDFDESERALLNLARPYLIQSYRQAQEISLLRAGLAESGQELIMLRREHWRIEPSQRAEVWLNRYVRGVDAQTGGLPESLRRWVALQRLQFKGDDLPRASSRLVFHSEDAGLSIRYLHADRVSEHDALLLQLHRCVPTPKSLVRLGLSPRESELLAGVAEGLTNLELAERHSISERTVEKHLSHIYPKLGVATRTAAVARVHQAALDGDDIG